MPTVDRLAGVLGGLQDPGVSFASKANLVEGGPRVFALLQEAGVGV